MTGVMIGGECLLEESLVLKWDSLGEGQGCVGNSWYSSWMKEQLS